MPRPPHILRLNRAARNKARSQGTNEPNRNNTDKTMSPLPSKSPFRSRTILALIVSLIGMAARFFKVDVNESEVLSFLSFLDQSWPAILEVGGTLSAIYFRFKATKVLTVRPGNVSPLLVWGLLLLGAGTLTAQAGDTLDRVIQDVEKLRLPVYVGVVTDDSGNLGFEAGGQVSEPLRLGVAGTFDDFDRMDRFYAILRYDLPLVLPSQLFQDYISVPDIHEARMYALLSSGVTWSRPASCAFSGVGVGIRFPILRHRPWEYYLEATHERAWCHNTLDPGANVFRTGVQWTF